MLPTVLEFVLIKYVFERSCIIHCFFFCNKKVKARHALHKLSNLNTTFIVHRKKNV